MASTLLLPARALALAARSTRAAPARTGSLAATTTLARTRLYHATAAVRSYKDDQDRESLKPRPSDSTWSGSDDEVAAHKEAFDGSVTNPEQEQASMEEEAGRDGSGGGGNPLDASGANKGFSKPPSGSHPDGPNAKPEKRTAKTGHGGAKKHGKTSATGAP